MLYIFLLGTIIGSFLNVCAFRIPRGMSLAFPASFCTSCNERIKVRYLFPVLSYMALKGRSSCCKSRISPVYPVVELFTGLIFLAVYIKYGMGFIFVKYTVFICLMVVIGLIDYKTQQVYLNTVLFGIATAVIFMAWEAFYMNINGCEGYIIAGLSSLAAVSILVLSTRGMGWGDAEIFLLCGLFLGVEKTVLTMSISFILGGIGGIAMLASGRKTRRSNIPFAPFITAASIIAVLKGNEIVMWYLCMF